MRNSADHSLLTNRSQSYSESCKGVERLSIVEIEIILRAFTVREKEIFLWFTTIFWCSRELEIPCRCLCNSSKEIESVATSLLVELWSDILKLVDDARLFLFQVELSYLEGSWLFSKEIRVIFDGLD